MAHMNRLEIISDFITNLGNHEGECQRDQEQGPGSGCVIHMANFNHRRAAARAALQEIGVALRVPYNIEDRQPPEPR